MKDTDISSSNGEERLHNYEEWMEFVEMDILSARYLIEAPFHPRPLAVVCYHAQQAAEKAVKALIVYYGSQAEVPKVHDILVLLNQIKNVVQKEKGTPISPHIYEVGARLNLFATAPRYPGELNITENDAKVALRQAQEIVDWVKSLAG